jgi:uncharacterized protein
MTTALDPAAVAAHKAIRCPRCGIEMTTFERSGVVLDQCRDCRGFFLDHGELERLVAAEGGAWLGPSPSQAVGVRGDASRHGHRRPVRLASAPPMPPAGVRYHSEWSVGAHDAARDGDRDRAGAPR